MSKEEVTIEVKVPKEVLARLVRLALIQWHEERFVDLPTEIREVEEA